MLTHISASRRASIARVACALAAILAAPLGLSAQHITAGGTGAAPASSPTLPPRAVRRTLPLGPMIRRAYAAGTRDSTGRPGRHYWRNRNDYVIDASLDVDSAIVRGHERITVHNDSPDTLHTVVLRLFQNYFRAETSRNDYVTDITQGDVVDRLVVDGTTIDVGGRDSAFEVDSTTAVVRLPRVIAPGGQGSLEVTWHFTVPAVREGERGERMGRYGTRLYQIAQWYPQVAMYDDLRGWDTDQYKGIGEFYDEYGSFDVSITLPAGWLVGATGTLQNPEGVYSPRTRERLALAMHADSTVHVVTAGERGAGATAPAPRLTWHFTAPLVNDFAWAASRDYAFDATRANAPDPVLVQVLFDPAHDYSRTAQYARFALEHHARVLFPYAWPQATIADGPERGMEYPMIIFDGPGFGVTTHELGHQWFPMMVASNETWYGWQDEGLNDYIDELARADFTHEPENPLEIGDSYRKIAGTELEAPMMWPTDYAGPGANVQAYEKAPVALHALGGIVGDSAVHRALAAYARDWKWKHPSPWDFFMTMNRELGQNLDWFWNAWWFTTETFDQAIAAVAQPAGALRVTIDDRGDMAMPVLLRVTFADGATTMLGAPASVWFDGRRRTIVTMPLRGRRVARLALDPENRFQDLDRSNNTWSAPGTAARGTRSPR